MHDNINDYKGYKLEVFEDVKEWDEYGPIRIAYCYEAVKGDDTFYFDFTSYERLTQELWELWIDLGLPSRGAPIPMKNGNGTISLPLNKERLLAMKNAVKF